MLTVRGRRPPPAAHRAARRPAARQGGEAWRASFAWPHGPADVESAELEIGRSVVVELPAPRRRKRARARARPRRRRGPALRAGRAARADRRAAQARAAASPEAEAVAESAEAVAESAEADTPRPTPSRPSASSAREAERAELREQLERARAPSATELREELANVRSEHDALGDQHAALIARSGDLRGQLADAIDAQEPLRGGAARARGGQAGLPTPSASASSSELERGARRRCAERDRELAGHREDAEQRLGAERRGRRPRCARSSPPPARRPQKALAAEAAETERIRAELAAAREEAERVLAAERAEVARLREELATARPPTDEDGEAEADDASRRDVRADLARARARAGDGAPAAPRAGRQERRDRRAAPLGRRGGHQRRPHGDRRGAGGRRPRPAAPAGAAAAVLASRAEVDARAPYRRADAARAAAAQRVPEHEQSAAERVGRPRGGVRARGAAADRAGDHRHRGRLVAVRQIASEPGRGSRS